MDHFDLGQTKLKKREKKRKEQERKKKCAQLAERRKRGEGRAAAAAAAAAAQTPEAMTDPRLRTTSFADQQSQEGPDPAMENLTGVSITQTPDGKKVSVLRCAGGQRAGALVVLRGVGGCQRRFCPCALPPDPCIPCCAWREEAGVEAETGKAGDAGHAAHRWGPSADTCEGSESARLGFLSMCAWLASGPACCGPLTAACYPHALRWPQWPCSACGLAWWQAAHPAGVHVERGRPPCSSCTRFFSFFLLQARV